MKTQSDKAEAFKALHQTGCFVFPNPWDVGSARLLAGMGFPALASTSQGFANALGVEDYKITRDMKMDHCRALCAAVDIPIAADLENGYGHTPEICAETIRLANDAGLVGGSIEDFNPETGEIYEIELAADRVRAAAEAADALPHPWLLTGRAENHLRGVQDLADTIKRLQAYQEAGAHVLYAPLLPDLAAIKSVLAEIDRPLNVLGPFVPNASVSDLAEAGVRRISMGSALANAAWGALVSAAEELQGPGTYGWISGTIPGKQKSELLAKGTPKG